jgi:NADPH-dependent 2,4-dienoyl-CoA reductase/sulfur reductase-like enzyme
MELAGVTVVRKSTVDRALVEREAPDVVILATGARPRWPQLEGLSEGHVVDAWQVLQGQANVGQSVVVADWRCDWIGIGLAEKLAADGCRVRLAVAGIVPGQSIPQYVRDESAARLNRLGVEVIPYARLFGIDGETAYFQHITSGEPLLFEGVDTLVLAQGHEAVEELADALRGLPVELHQIGDCLSPRTAEEAVLDGLRVASAL